MKYFSEIEFGKCLGYSGDPCPICGRFRLERYENGKEICEKCGWCPQNCEFVEDAFI
jgi:ribosomal protein L37AE/L43A